MRARRFLPPVLLVLVMTNVLNALSVTLLADEPSLRKRTDRLVQPYLDNGVVVGMSIGVLRSRSAADLWLWPAESRRFASA